MSKKTQKTEKKAKRSFVSTIIFALLTIVCVVATSVMNFYEQPINLYLDIKTQEIIPEEGATIRYWTEYQTKEDLVAYEKELCERIEGEGATLLVNKDNTLPLAKNSKISCFSQSSVNLLYGGTGSGQVSSEDAISLKAALEAEDVFGVETTSEELSSG